MPLATSTLAVILIAWVVFLVLLVAGLAVLVRRGNGEHSTAPVEERRGKPDRRRGQNRRNGSDRRGGPDDRRVGLPDLRSNGPERRRGPADRRSGTERRGGDDRRRAVRLQPG
jgi:hypothetical protein